MARAPRAWQPTLVMLVILPFWTSFLIRVYAWIGILKKEGLLNQLLLSSGLIHEPLTILNTNWAVYIGIVYSYLPFMVLPLYAALEKLDDTLLEAAADLGCPPVSAFWKITFPLVAARRHRRLLPGLHPGHRRVRHPRPPRRLGDADDRQDAVGRVLQQSRLAARLGGRRHPPPHPGGADRDLPEPGAARGPSARDDAIWFHPAGRSCDETHLLVQRHLGRARLRLPLSADPRSSSSIRSTNRGWSPCGAGFRPNGTSRFFTTRRSSMPPG